MNIATGTATADATCGDCGAPASGNFCSSCGADLRSSSLSFLGGAVAPVRRSFPIVYLKLLRAPIRQTVALAEDPTYRNYISFALAGIAIYCLFIVPVVMNLIVPVGGDVQVSDSLMTLMKILSQVGVYVGTVITFFLAYAVFRWFSPAPRTVASYFKLFCLALGFTAPINGAYEFVISQTFHGIGMSVLGGLLYQVAIAWVSHVAWATEFNLQAVQATLFVPTALSSLVMLLAMLSYSIGIHRRFWRLPVWKAAPLYIVTSIVANQIGFYVMWWVGFYSASVLIAAGIVTR